MVLNFGGGIFQERDVRETPTSDTGALVVGDFCAVYRSSEQSIQTGDTDEILFNAEEYDDSGMHSTSVDPERIVVTTPGLYLIRFETTFKNNGDVVIFRLYEGVTIIGKKQYAQSANEERFVAIETIRKVTVPTFYKITAAPTTGGAQTSMKVEGSAQKETKFTVIKIQ